MTASDFDHQGHRLAETPPGSGVTWGVKDLSIGVALVLFVFFLLSVVIVGPVVAIYGETSAESLFAQAATTALWDGCMVLIVISIVRRKGGDWAQLGLHMPRIGGLGRLVGVIGGAYIASLVLVRLYELIVDLIGVSALQPSAQIDDSFYSHTAALVVLGIAVVVTAPIAEEIFFRGFLFAGLDKRFGILPALLVSGLLFALAHTQGGLIIPFTGVGIVLALAYRYGDTLFADISVHFLFNLGSFLVLVFVPSAR